MKTHPLATQRGLARTRLLTIPLILTLALMSGVSWYVWGTYRTLQQIQNRDMRILELSQQVNYLDEALTMSARMAVATGEQSWLNRYRRLEPIGIAAVEEAAQLVPSIFESRINQQFEQSAEQLFAIENQAFERLQQGDRTGAATLLASNAYETQKQLYAEALQQITEGMKQHAQRSLAVQASKAETAIWFLAIAIVMLIAIWIVTLRLLWQSIYAVNAASHQIASVSSQVSAAVEEQDRLVVSQAGAVQQTTTAMDELSSSARQSTQQMEIALAEAKQAVHLADNGTQVVNETLSSLDTLQTHIGAIAQQIHALSEQVRQIGSISGLVSNLANQTNMLALNAAVEATRAGEHGRGFTVVASEIRKLADQSRSSAQKIANLVADIQGAVQATVPVMTEGNHQVSKGINLAHATVQTFEEVTQAINTITLNSQQISLTAKQQVVAIEQVVKAMNELNQDALRTTSMISQTRAATHQMKEAANLLNTLL